MTRVLYIRRKSTGSVGLVTDALARELEQYGVEIVIDDAEAWIPDKTGFWEDRKVSPLIKDAAKGFDLVHAWGYRSAWACAEGLYIRSPWVYTGLDWIRTKNQLLVDRLNHARLGICSSRALKNELDALYTLNLEVVVPSLPLAHGIDGTMARESLRISSDAKVVTCLVDDSRSESGLDVFLSVMRAIPGVRGITNISVPDAPANVKVEQAADWRTLIAASDCLVVPSRLASFSVPALMAMQQGVPVIMRCVGGLVELGVEGIHFVGFDLDEQLTSILTDWETGVKDIRGTEDAALTRAQSWLGMEESARRHADLYKRLLRD